MGKRKGKCARKNKVTKESSEPEYLVKAPHSFVIHRGQCAKDLMDLTKDFRKVMEPFTASDLKERKNNSIKDFVAISGYLHVSHMCIFTETELGSYFRIARLPRGPTLTFKLSDYTLARDVVSSLKKQYVIEKAFQNAPLIVLNSFSGEGMQMKLMANMFQNMFPTINISTIKLKNIRRCVLLNYNPSTKMIEFRHYVIRATPVGLNKATKKIIQGKIPNLGKCADISEFFEKGALMSESEFEDDPNSQLVLPQTLSNRGAAVDTKSAIRLFELGPRMTFQLIKVEDGLLDGEVLYHELINKSEEEKEIIRKKREEKRKLKEKRKKKQEDNLKRKEKEKEELNRKALEGIEKKKENITENQRLMEKAALESQEIGSDDDDVDYYKKEVGLEPEADLFDKPNLKRKFQAEDRPKKFKKMKLDKRFMPKSNVKEDKRGGQKKFDQNRDKKGGKKNFDHDKKGGRKMFDQNRDKRSGKKNFDQNRDKKGGNKNNRKVVSFKGKQNKNKFGGSSTKNSKVRGNKSKKSKN